MEAEKKDKAGLAANPTLPYLLGCGCLGLILLGIGLTIVMALIPTYLPSKADGLSRTNYTSMIAQMHAKAGTASRKRGGSSSLDPFLGAEFDAAGREQVRQIIRQYLNSPQVKDVSVLSVTIADRVDSSKKRMALDRDARFLGTIIYDIKMMFTFDNACPYFCQTKSGATLRQILYGISPDVFVLNNINLYVNGVLTGRFSQLRIDGISYVSAILSGFSPFQIGSGPATYAPTATSSVG